MHSASRPEDTLLLNRIAQGDEDAFRILFEQYRDRFYGVAIKMCGSAWVAEEIVQEVFITLWQRRNALTDVAKPSSYLFTVFYRIIYGHFKREAKEKRARNSWLEMPWQEEHWELDGKAVEEDQWTELEMAIGSLPPQQAMAYRLSKLEGLSRDQVADRMGISPNTVRNHLTEAMRTLRSSLGKLRSICMSWPPFW